MIKSRITYAPVCLFVFNRLEHTQKTVDALKKNILAPDSDLYIYSDAPKKNSSTIASDDVRAYIKTISGFKSVTIKERKMNFGLSKSIITGVTEILKKHKKIIVLEDDMISSKFFLKFMNDSLDFYKNEDSVASIHGYSIPGKYDTNTFFLRGADCWGWATWEDSWSMFETDGKKLYEGLSQRNLLKEFNFKSPGFFSGMLLDQVRGNNDSWAIRWSASVFLHNKLTLYPSYSLINNIGNDGSGVHCEDNNVYDDVYDDYIDINNKNIVESVNARKIYEKHFRKISGGLVQRIKYKVPSGVKKLIKNILK